MSERKKKTSKKKSVAFFERGSWYHRVKTLNDDYTVKYGKIGGFKTQEEAEESYYKCEEEFIKQSTASDIHNPDLLFKDYLVYWFEKTYSPRIEPATRMVGAYTLYNLLIPNIEKDIKLRLITTEYINSLLERIAPICVSAGNKGRELLNQAMNSAVYDEILKDNPVSEAKRYPRKKTKINIYNETELKKFLKIVSRDNWYLEVLLGLFCGLRKGEILGLKFGDFNVEKKTVRISRQLAYTNKLRTDMKHKGFEIVDYSLIEKNPKTENAIRTIRVPSVILEELENRRTLIEYRKSVNENYSDKDYISVQPNGELHAMTSLNIYLSKVCKRNGLKTITVHGLRHMFATILIEHNVPIVKISGLLGHSSIHTTYEYYCDVMDDTNRINAFMNNNFVPEGANSYGE